MGLVKITFDGSSVTSKQDADFNFHFADCKPAGVMKGLGGDCAFSTSNNYIYFQSGYIEVYGRRIYVENNTSIYITLDSTKYGYVCVTVDLDSNSVTLEKIENGTTYPTLTQENLHTGGTKYQFPICKYTKTTSSLTLDPDFHPEYVDTVAKRLEAHKLDVLNTVAQNYGPLYQRTYSSKSGNNYIFASITSLNASSSVISCYVGGTFVVFSSDNASGSGGVVYYRYLGVDKTLSVQLKSSGLYISASDGSQPKYVGAIR